MPNWCSNYLTIVGSKEEIEKVRDYVSRKETTEQGPVFYPFSFESILPTPPDALDGRDPFKKDGWYNWRVDNWGTKWELNALEIHTDYYAVSEDNDTWCVTYGFNTAWGPSTGITELVAKAFPTVWIHHSYDEPGMDFSGYQVYLDGECIDDTEFGFSVENAQGAMDGQRFFDWNGESEYRNRANQ